MRPASHTNALGSLFIAWGWEKVQGGSEKSEAGFTGMVRGSGEINGRTSDKAIIPWVQVTLGNLAVRRNFGNIRFRRPRSSDGLERTVRMVEVAGSSPVGGSTWLFDFHSFECVS